MERQPRVGIGVLLVRTDTQQVLAGRRYDLKPFYRTNIHCLDEARFALMTVMCEVACEYSGLRIIPRRP